MHSFAYADLPKQTEGVLVAGAILAVWPGVPEDLAREERKETRTAADWGGLTVIGTAVRSSWVGTKHHGGIRKQTSQVSFSAAATEHTSCAAPR